MSKSVSLRQLQVHQEATIEKINATGELGRRIREMGLVPGVKVQIMGKAPLKDPVALRLLGFTLSLRNSEADYVTVTPVKEE